MVQQLRRRAAAAQRRRTCAAPRRGAAATTHLAVIAPGAKAVADATQATRAARRSISLKVRVSGSDYQSLEHGLTHKYSTGLGNNFCMPDFVPKF
jgi:hypothetical protein